MPLTSRSPAIAMTDRNGLLIMSSPGHAELHKRSASDLIGHHWKEWVPENLHIHTERRIASAFNGLPQESIGAITRPDGTRVIGYLQMFSTIMQGTPVLVGSLSLLDETSLLLSETDHMSSRIDVVQYVAAISAELSNMLRHSGLEKLGGDMAEISAQTSYILEAAKIRKH